jgi:V/A-type H+/Na+-transporting ATPase subunit I
MIVKMKRYAFLVYHKEYPEFLETIREVGVVHIKEKAEGLPFDETTDGMMKQQQRIKQCIKQLQKREPISIEPQPGMDGQWVLDTVEGLQQMTESKNAALQIVLKEISLLQPWGNFSWDLVEKIKKAGKNIHFYTVNKSKYQSNWETQYNAIVIEQQSSQIYFVTVTDSHQAPEIAADLIKLPKHSLSDLSNQKEALEIELDGYQHALNELASFGIEKLNSLMLISINGLAFEKVKLNTEHKAENRIMLLEGWVPEEKEEVLTQTLHQQGIYFDKNAPSLTEQVPILLKNNAFSKLFEMIGSLYSLPDYREIDLTPFFAPFFMLFFGFCLGDAGYGLLMMIATIVLRIKAKPNMKPIWTLGFLFGISTFLMGIVGGTFFGILLLDLDIPWLNAFKGIMMDQKQLMVFAIVLGIAQIIFGMVLKAIRAAKMYGFKHSLSTIGWIIVIVGVGGSFGLSSKHLLDAELGKTLMLTFGILGGILVFFFNSPGKNLFLNFGLGLWEVYGTATGLLGDVLSYIRLFALGLSSAILGSVFNKLAFEMSGDIIIVSQIITVLILLLGHTINFFMAALGAFVHPLRLTFVEFYKNTGFTGGGKKYAPFNKIEEVK